MKSGSIALIICEIVITVFFILVVNNKKISDFWENRINKKIKNGITIGIIAIFLLLFIKQAISIRNTIVALNTPDENKEMFDECDKKIAEEDNFYKNIIKIKKSSEDVTPYIPEGFTYVEGTVDTGYVIEDNEHNQYVWIPCSNEDKGKNIKLAKYQLLKINFININDLYDLNYKDFLQSALQNGGYYISRYELGNENEKAVSKKQAKVWTDLSQRNALEVVSKMYERDDISCELINGYAYDTALKWIMETNSIDNSSLSNYLKKMEKKENPEIFSGRDYLNNIADFFDNCLEISSEISYDTSIIRGFPYVSNVSDSNYYDIYNDRFDYENRYAIKFDDVNLSMVDYLSMRTVLYEKNR